MDTNVGSVCRHSEVLFLKLVTRYLKSVRGIIKWSLRKNNANVQPEVTRPQFKSKTSKFLTIIK